MTPSNQPPETDALPPLEAAILSPASSLPGPGIPTAPSCNMRFFQEGEVIFTEGSRSDTAYIIESGQVEIFLGSGDDIVQLSVLEPGDIFGEMGLIDNSPRSASAQAIAACQCITISTTQIAERIAASHPLVKLLISISLHRNRAYNQYFKALPSTSHGSLPNLAATEKAYTKNPDHRKIIDEIKLESDLHKAVGNDELQPYYQPLFSIRHNSIVGFESLLRWQSPGRGMVSPGQFMSLAEETSLIVPIGDWILEQACIDLKTFQAQWQPGLGSPSHLFMSVNISVRQFQEPNFCEKLLAVTERHGVPPQHLKLEVTERIFLGEDDAVKAIANCRAAGFQVSLDDFGTGYSSLSYLERCEIDSLKIDQSFTQKICTSPRAKILVNAIIDVAQKLGLVTIAEGIETEDHRLVLEEIGCDIGQGYLFSRPLPFQAVLEFLANPPHQRP